MAENTYAGNAQRTNTAIGSGSFGQSHGKQRAGFALPGDRFPLNTPGRVAAAPGMAERSLHAGNISAAQAAQVKRAAAAKRKRKGLVASAIEGSPAEERGESKAFEKTEDEAAGM